MRASTIGCVALVCAWLIVPISVFADPVPCAAGQSACRAYVQQWLDDTSVAPLGTISGSITGSYYVDDAVDSIQASNQYNNLSSRLNKEMWFVLTSDFNNVIELGTKSGYLGDADITAPFYRSVFFVYETIGANSTVSYTASADGMTGQHTFEIAYYNNAWQLYIDGGQTYTGTVNDFPSISTGHLVEFGAENSDTANTFTMPSVLKNIQYFTAGASSWTYMNAGDPADYNAQAGWYSTFADEGVGQAVNLHHP